jgi:hypothetical protein
MYCGGSPVAEHVLFNFGVPPGYSGPLSALNPPAFLAGPQAGYVWARFTVSEKNVVSNWDGVEFFDKGETEDYLLKLDIIEGMDESHTRDLQLKVFPNPSSEGCMISYVLKRPANVRIDVIDLSGRLTATIANGSHPTGKHMVRWDGRTAEGTMAGAGIYFIRVMLNETIIYHARVLLSK